MKDFFIDEKIPRWERDRIPLFEINGKIVWVYPYKRSSDFKIKDSTEEVIEIGVAS